MRGKLQKAFDELDSKVANLQGHYVDLQNRQLTQQKHIERLEKDLQAERERYQKLIPEVQQATGALNKHLAAFSAEVREGREEFEQLVLEQIDRINQMLVP